MLRFSILLAAAVSLLGAENPWVKVKDLKTGQEVRVVKKASHVPLIGNFADLTDENLIVVIKNEEIAIPRGDIDRIDARPAGPASRIKRDSKTEVKDPEASRGNPYDSRLPQTNSTSAISMGEKPGFETVYRRTAAGPQPAPQPK